MEPYFSIPTYTLKEQNVLSQRAAKTTMKTTSRTENNIQKIEGS